MLACKPFSLIYTTKSASGHWPTAKQSQPSQPSLLPNHLGQPYRWCPLECGESLNRGRHPVGSPPAKHHAHPMVDVCPATTLFNDHPQWCRSPSSPCHIGTSLLGRPVSECAPCQVTLDVHNVPLFPLVGGLLQVHERMPSWKMTTTQSEKQSTCKTSVQDNGLSMALSSYPVCSQHAFMDDPHRL